MTNIHDTWDTAEKWKSIKQEMLDRADVMNELTEDESEALNKLRWASVNLAESASYLMHFHYEDIVDFVRAYDVLAESYKWNLSECEQKRIIVKNCAGVVAELKSDYGSLNTRDVRSFETVTQSLRGFYHTSPSKYQMGKFTEHGITWEGEVYDY